MSNDNGPAKLSETTAPPVLGDDPQSADKATRVYFEGWALALTFAAEEEFRAGHFGYAVACVLMSLGFQFLVVKWGWVKTQVPPQSIAAVRRIAADPKWWLATLMVFFLYLAFSPIAQQARLPFSAWFDQGYEAQKATLIDWLQLAQQREQNAAKQQHDAAPPVIPDASPRIAKLESDLSAANQQLAEAKRELGQRPPVPTQPTEENPVLGNGPEIELIKRLPSGDKARLSEVFYEVGKLFADADELFSESITLKDGIFTSAQNGDLGSKIGEYDNQFAVLMGKARAFSQAASNNMQKWRYYERQVTYAIGDPQAMKSTLLWNSLSDFKTYFDQWSKTNNKEEKDVLELLNYGQNRFTESVQHFRAWYKGGEHRLSLMKDALQ